MRRLRLSNMAVGLTLGVSAVVVAAFSVGAYVYSTYHYGRMLEAGRASAQSEAEIIRVALEHQMVARDRSMIDRMVASFGADPSVSAVRILDHAGQVVYSSLPAGADPDLAGDGRTCRSCHDQPPEHRARSRVVDTDRGQILRIVTPLRNRPECHGCHGPTRRINGVLIVDVNAGAMRRGLHRDLGRMILLSGLLALVVMGGVAATIRVAILRRLRRFAPVARAIAAGDLERRLPVEGDDTLTWLAVEFNTLADAVTGLAADVRRQSQRLEAVLNSVDDGILVLDRDLKIVAANDSFIRRTGKPRAAVVGRPCCEAAGGFCRVGTCAARLYLEQGVRRPVVVECAGADGRARAEEVQVSPVRDRDETVRFVVEAWRDITDRRAAEARMAESHRLASLGMLASGFSHELNTPLGSTLTCVEGIQRTAAGAAPDLDYVRESARVAREQLLRCRAITRQFLRMARGDAAPADLIDLEVVVPEVIRLLAPLARERRVEVTAAAGDGPVTVSADLAAVQQVVLNLLLNAVQASAPGGRVVVTVAAGPAPRLTVADEGRGMTADEQRRIFEPFFSLRPGGTGLGLFISLEAARAWGGDIRVESAPGQGARFEVCFPAAAGAGGGDD
ncbi:MAG TPA: ATP-binding protein [Polyangia bacterium]